MLTATDKGTIRIVVIAVALLAIACVAGVIALALDGTTVPSTLEVTTGVAVGGLVGLLSSTRSGAGGAEAVQAAAFAQAVAQPLPAPGNPTGAVAPIVVNLEQPAGAGLATAGTVDPGEFGGDYAVALGEPTLAQMAAETKGKAPGGA
jgi:hypothetical protein